MVQNGKYHLRDWLWRLSLKETGDPSASFSDTAIQWFDARLGTCNHSYHSSTNLCLLIIEKEMSRTI